MKGLPEAQLGGFVTQVLIMINSDMDAADALTIAALAKKAQNWEIVENRLPYDGMHYSSKEMLVPSDMGATKAKLRTLIYDGVASDTANDQAGQVSKVQQALNDAGLTAARWMVFWGRLRKVLFASIRPSTTLRRAELLMTRCFRH